jgi:acetyl-CoA decarbonylase/synthase complex subunit delta
VTGKKQKSKKVKPEYGKGRAPGTAGPEATYIMRSLDRWRLRGDGVMK